MFSFPKLVIASYAIKVIVNVNKINDGNHYHSVNGFTFSYRSLLFFAFSRRLMGVDS